MKRRIFMSVILIFFFITPIIADEISTTECMKLESGTWVNYEYRNEGEVGKQIRYENGMVDLYLEASDTEMYRKGKIIINEAWTDNEGDVWFKSHNFVGEYFEGAEPHTFNLNKISNSRTVLEYIWSYHDYPTEIDPDHILYRIYYRQ